MCIKPNKYGIKIIMISDNTTKYMSAILYCGKRTVLHNTPASNYFVEHLVLSIKGSNYNITMDN